MPRLLWIALLPSLCGACVRVPARHDRQPSADASLDAQLAFDAGPRMPEAGPPYRGPECDPAPGSSGGAGTLDTDDPGHDTGAGESDGGRGGAGGMTSAHPGSGGAGSMPSPGAGGGASMQETLRHPLAGEVVITEIMSNPAAVRDDAGEWFELRNPGAHALELGGCTIDDGAATMHALPAPLAIAPGAYLVISRGPEAGVTSHATLSFSLGNSADVLALICDGRDVDRVAYDASFPLASGASMSLDPSAGARENDAASAWCVAQQSYGEDRGTPGSANPACDDAGVDGGS
jgi:hypothetical protein